MSVSTSNQYDIIVIGAGLSGICAIYHLQKKFPNKKIAVLEARNNFGGTWDLFKYPGIRSDSDMYTLGFSFYPWKNPKAIANAQDIMSYIEDTIDTFDLAKYIQYNTKVLAANWKSTDKHWEINIQKGDASATTIHADFVISCTGYYDYEQGYQPKFNGSDHFKGKIMHPQHWDTDLDYTDKKVVVIGSGATAITIVPEMAKKAANVTMLQRSPTYIVSLPSKDIFANFLKKILPMSWAHGISRWKNIMVGIGSYYACRKWPNFTSKVIRSRIAKYMGDNYNEDDFNPKYKPWDQRLCLIPDSDLLDAIKNKSAQIVTNTIDSFTENGIKLSNGEELEADIIVTATGLKMKMLGGIKGFIDGKEINSGEMKAYKGVMCSDIPNLGLIIGYTNNSWTLKCDLNCQYIVKLIQYMDENNHKTCTPVFDESRFQVEPLLDFEAGYIKRSLAILPKQGSEKPWKVHQNYIKDLFSLRYSSVKNEALKFE